MTLEAIIISIIAVIIISTATSIFIFGRKKIAAQRILAKDISLMMSNSGVDIPVLETYSGIKAFAPIVFGGNNLNPQFILFADHFAYKVLFRKSAQYSDIDSIRSYRSRYYNTLQIKLKNRITFLKIVFANEDTLQAVLDFLGMHGIRPDERSRL